MSDYQDNPKLTAYALGEADPSDIQQIEAILAGDADARVYVECIRQTAEVVTTSLQDEMQSLPLSPIKLKTSRPRSAMRILVVAAAAACVAITVGVVMMPTLSNARSRLSDKAIQRMRANSTTPGQPLYSQAMPANGEKYQKLVPAKDQVITAQPSPTIDSLEAKYLRQLNQAEAKLQSFPVVMGSRPSAPGEEQAKREFEDATKQLADYRSAKSDPTVRVMLENMALIRSELTNMSIDLGSNHPRVQQMTARLHAQEKLADEYFSKLGINGRPVNTESYDRVADNAFMDVADNPLSTFSVDVDTASYSNIRRFLTMNQLPPKDAVRIEEMVNYFSYDYPQPTDGRPFATAMELASCPWNEKHQLLRIAIKGKEIAIDKRPPSNLVFLLDVSGSMSDQNKLPLVKQSMKALLSKLGENDRIAIVVYAGSSGLVLSSTSAMDKARIAAAIDELSPGGSTNGAQGIELAYAQAAENFIKDGTNRVILCTDGDFNVGITDQGSLTRLIEEKAKSGVFLSVLGFGMGNTKDSTMEKLADKGNGNYAYIDTLNEARKVLVEQMTGTLITIAKDVKLQLEFNPAKVSSYRLIGYENRVLAKEDFNNDKKDAGEIGAGHTVTALYEITPTGEAGTSQPAVDPLKYQKPAAVVTDSNELLTLKLRYKKPDADTSELIEFTMKDAVKTFSSATKDFQFASAVAGFGMILRDSPYKGTANLGAMLEIAQSSKGEDLNGYRAEFIELIKKAQQIKK